MVALDDFDIHRSLADVGRTVKATRLVRVEPLCYSGGYYGRYTKRCVEYPSTYPIPGEIADAATIPNRRCCHLVPPAVGGHLLRRPWRTVCDVPPGPPDA